MNKQHPAIAAYARLRKQTDDNPPLLHFSLAQQVWLEVRGSPRHTPSDYSLVWLRAMSAAFVIAYGRDDPLPEIMGSFERQYRALAESIVEDDDRPMRRTRHHGNVIPFPAGGRKERP